jgi:hypothetical protein
LRTLAGDLPPEDSEQLTFLVLDRPKMIEPIPVDVLLYAALDQGTQLARRNGVQLDRRSIAPVLRVVVALDLCRPGRQLSGADPSRLT